MQIDQETSLDAAGHHLNGAAAAIIDPFQTERRE
jgi:hypothetical protein